MNNILPLKDFQQIPGHAGGKCPVCGKWNDTNEGSSFSCDDGSFFWCAYCNSPSVLIYNGARFNFEGTIYEIVEMTDPSQSLIATIEINRPGASSLWKPSPGHYQYFERTHIIEYMNNGYREDL